MKPRRTKTPKSSPAAFPAWASNLPLPGPPRMFSSWSKTRRNTPRLAAGGLPTSRMANPAARRCTKIASAATSLSRIATLSLPVTRLPPEWASGHCENNGPNDAGIGCRSGQQCTGYCTALHPEGYSPMKTNKLLVSAVLATAIGAPIARFVVDVSVAQPVTSTGIRVPFLHGFPTRQTAGQTELTSLERANEWLNSPPLTASALHGKVVLIDFWTYTCINWLRTLPYVRAWAEKYRNEGLMVIGVHAPEFAFEKNISNVRRAVKEMRIDYPIAVDNEHAIWRAFSNQYWPALYFVDAEGRVRHHHFGEGAYEQSEMIIQALLAETGVG